MTQEITPQVKTNNSPSGPPDLDEILNRFFRGLKRKHPTMDSGDGGQGGDKGRGDQIPGGSFAVGFIGFLIFIVWMIAGVYIVAPAEEAVVKRFGRYVRTVGAGPHWLPRLIETKQIVNVQEIMTFPYTAEMLTKDENIVSVQLAVQYRIEKPEDYLYQVVTPQKSLQQATASALRGVIGRTVLDDVLTAGSRQSVVLSQQIQEHITEILKPYRTGLKVTSVTLQSAKPPEAVRAAFDDAIQAREDEQRYKNLALAYTEKVQRAAQGQAVKILEAAKGYKEQEILKATGESAKFLALLPEYQRAPSVTKERLYLASMESVLSRAGKVLVDAGGSNIMYLPLNKMLAQSSKYLPLLPMNEMDSTNERVEAMATPPNGGANYSRPDRTDRGANS